MTYEDVVELSSHQFSLANGYFELASGAEGAAARARFKREPSFRVTSKDASCETGFPAMPKTGRLVRSRDAAQWRAHLNRLAAMGASLALLAVFGVALGILVTGPLRTTLRSNLDAPTSRFFWSHKSSTGTALCNWVSNFASVSVTALIAAAAGVTLGRRRRSIQPTIQFGAAFAGAVLLTVVVRFAVTRPAGYGPEKGFPSGHTMLAVTVFGTLALYAAGAAGSRVLRWSAVGALALTAMAVAVARLYLVDHLPSDVLASLVLGGAWVSVIARLEGSELCVRTQRRQRARSRTTR